jgi:hypothetical protein
VLPPPTPKSIPIRSCDPGESIMGDVDIVEDRKGRVEEDEVEGGWVSCVNGGMISTVTFSMSRNVPVLR